MQVRNDYTYQNQNYEHAHSHNITDCLHEETKKKQGQVAGGSKAESSIGTHRQQRTDSMELSYMIQHGREVQKEKNIGFSKLKGFWESLGEESGEKAQKVPLSIKERVFSHVQGIVHSAQTAVHSLFQKKLLHSVTVISKKIKMEISTALRRFKRGKDNFTALTEEGMTSGQNAYGRRNGQKGQVATNKKEEEVPLAKLSNSHLMDSYSKTGAYCQLNENLTYQKPKERVDKR